LQARVVWSKLPGGSMSNLYKLLQGIEATPSKW
jgi:pyruvate/oxaloacetate carboxyltransferase